MKEYKNLTLGKFCLKNKIKKEIKKSNSLGILHKKNKRNLINILNDKNLNYSKTIKLFQNNDNQLVLNLPISHSLSNLNSDRIRRQNIDENFIIKQNRLGINLKLPKIISERNYEKNNNINQDYQKQKQKLKNDKNIFFEKNLKDKLKEIEVEIDKFINEKNNIYKKLKLNYNQIENYKYEVELLNSKYDKFFKGLSKRENKDENINNIKSKEEKKEEIENNKIQLEKLIEENNKNLLKLDEKIQKYKKEKNEIIEKMMEHYKQLLYEGFDTRKEGLSWIIKEIWKLNKNVPIDFFPTFLDLKSINFLFLFSQKSNELFNKRRDLINLKNEINKIFLKKKNINKEQKKKKLIFQTQIKKNEISENKINIENNKTQISKIMLPQINKINIIKNEIENLDNEIKKLKKDEIKRIFNEFFKNNYKERFKVIIDIVLSALIGENEKDKELIKYIKFQNDYQNNLMKINFLHYPEL